eukprot:scaffold27432_cov41-Phaeocystis_antarctica.AAC.2
MHTGANRGGGGGAGPRQGGGGRPMQVEGQEGAEGAEGQAGGMSEAEDDEFQRLQACCPLATCYYLLQQAHAQLTLTLTPQP